MGRDPVWADFSDAGFAVHRAFEDELESQIEDADARILVVTGTAGSGKSSTLMRFGLGRQARGENTLWIDFDLEFSIPRLRSAIRNSAADVLLIDDADAFGHQTGPLLKEIAEENPGMLIAASITAARYEALSVEHHLAGINFTQLTVPHLGDADIELLIESLERANRLGRLREMRREEQVAVFQRESGRQLLVAMIQATSGERFEEKIDKECADLDRDSAFLYAVIAVATSLRQYLTRQEVVLASADASNESMNKLQSLINQHLVTVRSGNQLRVRHRVVADRTVDYFRRNRQLGEPIRGLMFALATSIDAGRYPRSREGRLLMRIMNHAWLMRNLPGDREAIRAAYDEVEEILAWDSHYWLQRGSFEVEIGDIRLAQNFLEQARALAPDDYKVQTEWAYMVIKRAVQNPAAPESRERVEEAFVELEDAVLMRGHQDPYPAHIMGSQGLAWARAAPLTQDEKLTLLAHLRQIVERVRGHHPTESDLRQLTSDLEAEYLLVGAVRPAT